VESLESILNATECEILQKEEALKFESNDLKEHISFVIKLNLVPQSDRKFILIDIPKDIYVELRSLPALELIVALPETYPSAGKPLLLSTTQFYNPFKEMLYEKLNEKWSEDMLVLYEYVCFLQEEFINAYLEGGTQNNFKTNDKGNIEISFNSSA